MLLRMPRADSLRSLRFGAWRRMPCLGFAIVGCGMIARFHARALAEVPGTRVAALVSRNRRQRREADRRDWTSTVRRLHRPGRGAEARRTSTSSSSPRRAARTWSRPSPRPRPASTSSSRSRWRSPSSAATASSTPATRTGSSSAPSSRRASATPTSTLKAAVDAGRFGRLTLGETTCKWWRSQAYYDEGGWKGTQALDGGGALMNQAIHNVDLLLWMMGPVDARHRLHRHAGPRAHRGRGHGRRLPALRERRPRRHPGDDERPSRAAQDDRASTATRARRSSSRRTCCAGTSRRRPPDDAAVKAAVRPEGRGVRRGERPGGDLARGPRPAAGRLRARDRRRTRRRRWMAARAARPSR